MRCKFLKAGLTSSLYRVIPRPPMRIRSATRSLSSAVVSSKPQRCFMAQRSRWSILTSSYSSPSSLSVLRRCLRRVAALDLSSRSVCCFRSYTIWRRTSYSSYVFSIRNCLLQSQEPMQEPRTLIPIAFISYMLQDLVLLGFSVIRASQRCFQRRFRVISLPNRIQTLSKYTVTISQAIPIRVLQVRVSYRCSSVCLIAREKKRGLKGSSYLTPSKEVITKPSYIIRAISSLQAYLAALKNSRAQVRTPTTITLQVIELKAFWKSTQGQEFSICSYIKGEATCAQ